MSHLLYQDGEAALLVEVQSSFVVEAGEVRPLGAKLPPGGRERQRSRIRERILATGLTTARTMAKIKRILKERIVSRMPRLPR